MGDVSLFLKRQSYITDIDDCDGVTCLNGGSCEDGVNSFTCRCDVGYTGTHCGQSKLLNYNTKLKKLREMTYNWKTKIINLFMALPLKTVRFKYTFKISL